LFRAENPDVADYVAAELHIAIDEYVRSTKEHAIYVVSDVPLQSPS